MITVKVQIPYSSGSLVDTTQYGFIYLDSDKRVGAEAKGFETTAYPEEEGEHIIPKSVDAPFDYVVKFFVQASSIDSANKKIKDFNALLYTQAQGSSVKTYKQVAFYNYYKRHAIVGYPKPIAMATDFWRDPSNQVNDIVIVEWTIRVTQPSLCEFNLAPPQ